MHATSVYTLLNPVKRVQRLVEFGQRSVRERNTSVFK